MAVSFDRALAIVLGTASPLGEESVSIAAGLGRTIAHDLVAPTDVPAYRRSAVDGFAVRSTDLAEPSELQIVGSIVAGGDATEVAARMSSVARSCCRVATGAPLPAAADAVVMVEHVELRSSLRAAFKDKVAAGKHVIGVGEDVQLGERLLTRGRRLRAQDLGVLASLGLEQIEVQRAPKVEIVVTGNEIVALGCARSGTQIVDSNSIVLSQLAKTDGAEVAPASYTGDDPSRIEQCLLASRADVLLVSGGSSVGEEDHAPRVLERVGSVAFRGVRMRPGSPTAFGNVGSKAVFLVPGHPLACLAAYETLIGPFLRVLGARHPSWPHRALDAVLARAIESAPERTDYVRVERLADGTFCPMARHLGASNLSSALRADGVVLVPSDVVRIDAGAVVRVFLY